MLTAGMAAGAQDSITLVDCHQLAVENAPRLLDRQVLREMGELNLKQAGAMWYPNLEINGKVSYQSDVVEVALTDPTIPVSFPKVPHDQYGLNLDLKQTLYDGGLTRSKKSLEEARTAADLQQVEVDLHQLKNRVNQYFFGILLLQENLRNLDIHRATLDSRKSAVATAVREGAMLPSEMQVIEVEILRIRQSEVEVKARRKAFLEALNILCGTSYADSDVFVLPRSGLAEDKGLNRPEYVLFDLKEASLEAGKELISKKRMPVLFAFGQTGYGNPGYNMLSSQWDFYYMVGAGLTWNLWDWNTTNREREKVEKQQQVLLNKRGAFDREIQTKLVQEKAKIDQYRESRDLEEQMLELRESITKTAAASLENGTITATDYITELNKESLVRISLTSHEILLNQAITNYLTIQGNL